MTYYSIIHFSTNVILDEAKTKIYNISSVLPELMMLEKLAAGIQSFMVPTARSTQSCWVDLREGVTLPEWLDIEGLEELVGDAGARELRKVAGSSTKVDCRRLRGCRLYRCRHMSGNKVRRRASCKCCPLITL